jgi:uncharacterized membrane protein
MKQKTTSLERMLLISIAFTIILLIIRITITSKLTYVFFAWNLFLAIVPILFSRQLNKQQKLNIQSYSLLAGWLLFFPNAPYIITDIFHYTERPPVPKWYDLLLVTSAAWNGLLLGIVSLMQVEQFLQQHITKKWTNFYIAVSIMLCGYGIYIGRFLRFNSWDILTNPDDVLYTSAHYFLKPWQHIYAWGFIVLFAGMFGIVYYTLKNIQSPKNAVSE